MGYEKFDGRFDVAQHHEPIAVALEERAVPRFTLLIRTAKLVCGEAEYLCVIRDVSAEGVSARLFHPLPPVSRLPADPDARFVLEMQTGDLHPVRAVWEKPGEAGFQFLTPVDVEQMIRRSSQFPKRELRFTAQLPVKLVVPGAKHPAMLHNISQQGAMIEAGEHLKIAQTMWIESRSLPDIEAKVRWRQGERYGLIFDTTFRMGDLAEIIRLLQKRVGGAGKPPS
ncbi:PilZ domain-containing protein [Allopontixanthobacter sp.]|uniref:PilZ domain-containing protein n=1 Tax=Allopontixanthobacter sp. TaxID=2906452 RepID=UPI002AB959F9|nr:PilZ domain-containing protein [Allopontixanthobacter sp.]MDZ4306506.1 PilZ domain-containing protein [Allopontixanthobacter sp.]